jgi:hypothetical protein
MSLTIKSASRVIVLSALLLTALDTGLAVGYPQFLSGENLGIALVNDTKSSPQTGKKLPLNKLEITDFNVSQGGQASSLLQGLPITFSEQIKNDEGTIEHPGGSLTILEPNGHILGIINLDHILGGIKPLSKATFSEVLNTKDIGGVHLFGQYIARLKIIYGKNANVLTDKLSFWIIPLNLIVSLIVILIIGLVIVHRIIRHTFRRTKLINANLKTGRSR